MVEIVILDCFHFFVSVLCLPAYLVYFLFFSCLCVAGDFEDWPFPGN